MKKDTVKIVTIGGGSSYTPELVEGFIKRYDTLPVRELWLVDIEEGREKLETVGALAQRMVKKANLPMKVILSYDRQEALKDADFVTTQMRIGRLPARVEDERIPLSHGMIGQETNGAGGMFKAFRTIPVILDIVKDMQKLCPNAWMINFTNPAGMVTEAILRYTDFKKVIGLCNVPVNMVAGIAKILGVEENRVTLELQGVNHFIFATDVFVDGSSVMDTIVEKYANVTAEDTLAMKNFISLPYSPSFIRGLHAIPCPYHNYYFFTKEQLDEEIAKALYIGIIHDTGVFQYSNTSPETLRAAAKLISYGFDFSRLIEETFYEKTYLQTQILGRALLESILFMDGKCVVSVIDRKTMDFYGASPQDLEGIVSQLRSIKGVECAIFMYETGVLEYKVSMRSGGLVNVSQIASYFGGGGHVRAAGCTMNGTCHDVINNLSLHIEKQL